MDPFSFKLIASALIGGIWTILSTVIADKAGPRAGGVIAGLPSAIVVALFSIGWTQSERIAAQATTSIPLVLGIVAVFNMVYVLLYRRPFLLAIGAALGVWFLLAFAFVVSGVESFGVSVLGFLALLSLSYHVVEKRLPISAPPAREMRYSLAQLGLRGLLGGGIIAFATTMARVGGPIIGGVFAAFPTLMLATMIINHHVYGPEFAAAFVKTIMISGTVNTTIYAAAVRFLYPGLGLVPGTLGAFAISLLSGYVVYRFVQTRST